MFSKYLLLLAISLLAVVLGGCQVPDSGNGPPLVIVGDKEFRVEVADTREKKERGLSRRETLAEDAGMLFVYEEPQKPSFWMKDMFIPLDFIWINNGEVVEMHRNVQPVDLQPPNTLEPGKEVDLVLEVNAGIIDKYDIEIGDKVETKK